MNVPPNSQHSSEALTSESVHEAYRLILGRPPESDVTVANKIRMHQSITHLYQSLLDSHEFANRLNRPPAALPTQEEIGRQCTLLGGEVDLDYSPECLAANAAENGVDSACLADDFRRHLVEDDREPFRDTLYFNNHIRRFRLLVDLVLSIRKKPASVLEVGGAHLHLSALLSMAGFSVSASDVPDFVHHPRYAARARQLDIDHRILDLADLDQSPYVEQSFDIIIFSEILEHLNFSPLPAFLWMNRLLKPDGAVIISTPNAFNRQMMEDYSALRATPFEPVERFVHKPSYCLHHRLYTHREIAYLCEGSGLSVVIDSWEAIRPVTHQTLPNGEDPILIVARKPA